MFELSFTSNSDSIDRRLGAFDQWLRDLSPAMRQIADDFREMIREQFSTEGRAGGTPWAALAPSTQRNRRRSGSSILNDTGTLLRSLIEPEVPGHVEEMDPTSLTIGSDLPYGAFHQTGTGVGFGQTAIPHGQHQRGMPMRPIIVLSDEKTAEWTEVVRQYLEQGTLLLGEKELGGA